MKKKLLEKDIFYLSLFICVCLVAFGGILFTNKNLNKLVASKDTINKDNEINLVKEKNDSVPTSTESKENLEKAKEKNAKNITGDSSIFEKSPATNFILYSNKLNGLIALSFL